MLHPSGISVDNRSRRWAEPGHERRACIESDLSTINADPLNGAGAYPFDRDERLAILLGRADPLARSGAGPDFRSSPGALYHLR